MELTPGMSGFSVPSSSPLASAAAAGPVSTTVSTFPCSFLIVSTRIREKLVLRPIRAEH